MKKFEICRCWVFVVGCLISVGAVSTGMAQDTPEIVIWPGGVPESGATFSSEFIAERKSKESIDLLRFVDRPTLSVYQPPESKANGCAVIVCPGGGYNVLAWTKEGTELAEWLNSIGVTAFVLKYRIPRRTDKIHSEPMQDIQRAIRVVRRDAKRWGIDPNRLGTLGFSAGGHLVVMSGVQFSTKCYDPVDDADQLSARPDFICPIYAAYLADGYRDDVVELGPIITVTQETPPTFLAATWDDRMRGAQSALLFARLKENKVKAEIHIYTNGGHGYGIRPTDQPVSHWHEHLEAWLGACGFLTSSAQPSLQNDPNRK